MIKWPWVSRKRFEENWELGKSISDTQVKRIRDLKSELSAANARLARIAALETPNAAHGVRKAVRIAKGLD